MSVTRSLRDSQLLLSCFAAASPETPQSHPLPPTSPRRLAVPKPTPTPQLPPHPSPLTLTSTPASSPPRPGGPHSPSPANAAVVARWDLSETRRPLIS